MTHKLIDFSKDTFSPSVFRKMGMNEYSSGKKESGCLGRSFNSNKQKHKRKKSFEWIRVPPPVPHRRKRTKSVDLTPNYPDSFFDLPVGKDVIKKLPKMEPTEATTLPFGLLPLEDIEDDVGHEIVREHLLSVPSTSSRPPVPFEQEMVGIWLTLSSTVAHQNTNTPIRAVIDAQQQELLIFEEKKLKITLSFIDIVEFRFGLKTKEFERNKNILKHFIPLAVCTLFSTYCFLFPPSGIHWQCIYSLIQLTSYYKEATSTEHRYLQALWTSLDSKDHKNTVSSILKALHIHTNIKEVQKQFAVAKFDSGFEIADLHTMIRSMRDVQQIQSVFKKYSSQGKMTKENFLSFLVTEQQEVGYTKETLHLLTPSSIIGCEQSIAGGVMGYDEFSLFIESSLNTAFNPRFLSVYQDMSRPITDYYINSSHNTYLESNQLSGYSSSEMYARVLKAGCRCVELDCWNGDDGEPIIFHGFTLTSKILFEDAVKVIADYAFVASPFPVILSLENHCNLEQQTKMALIMKRHFGNRIAEPLWKKRKNFKLTYLPSPEDLKYKIIIKGKVTSLFSTMKNSNQVPPELESITYLVSVPCSDIKRFVESPLRVPWEICSFVEKCLQTRALPNSDFMIFNHTNLSRVYPKGARVESSNYSPTPWWCGGSQLVALNLQTNSTKTWIHEGLFRDNGACGYVLKPFYLRPAYQNYFDPAAPVSFCPIELKITIICGRQLPSPHSSTIKKKEALNPFVAVCLFGYGGDTKKQKTQIVAGNSFNPYWDDTFTFCINNPEVAVLLLSIKHFSSPPVQGVFDVAYGSIPLSCLRTGYRTVCLHQRGKQIPLADLIIHSSITYR